MMRYQDRSGNSGVVAYAIANDSILIKFKDGETYKYSYRKPGLVEVEAMKELAVKGEGLATYINTNVRQNYDHKLDS